LLHAHYRRFNARTGGSVADRRIDIPPRGSATCRFSTHRPSTFTCSVGEPELRSCRLYTGCRWVDLQIPLPALPAGSQYPTVLTASWNFDASSVGSLAFTFSAHTFRPLGPIFAAVAHHHGLLGHSSTAWFEACFCTPASRGLPSSPLQHRESDPSGSRSRRTWLIPLSEAHLRRTLRSWVQHYNRGRPHMGFDPGIPKPPAIPNVTPTSRHRRRDPYVVRADPILGGLHHEYTLVTP
jgi:hypothetical protein